MHLLSRRLEDNIRMDLQEMGLDWIDLDQDRDRLRALVNALMTIPVSYGAGKFFTN